MTYKFGVENSVQPGEKEMRDFTIALPSQSKVTEKIQPKDTVCINRNSGIY